MLQVTNQEDNLSDTSTLANEQVIDTERVVVPNDIAGEESLSNHGEHPGETQRQCCSHGTLLTIHVIGGVLVILCQLAGLVFWLTMMDVTGMGECRGRCDDPGWRGFFLAGNIVIGIIAIMSGLIWFISKMLLFTKETSQRQWIDGKLKWLHITNWIMIVFCGLCWGISIVVCIIAPIFFFIAVAVSLAYYNFSLPVLVIMWITTVASIPYEIILTRRKGNDGQTVTTV